VLSKIALFPPERIASTNQKLNSLRIWSCIIDICNVRTEELANNSPHVMGQSLTPVTIPHMTVAVQTIATAGGEEERSRFSQLRAGHWCPAHSQIAVFTPKQASGHSFTN
jgi:hypothetical protein